MGTVLRYKKRVEEAGGKIMGERKKDIYVLLCVIL